MKTANTLIVGSLALASAVVATPALGDAKAKRTNTPPITTNGNAFFSGSDRFFIRGVDYQPGGSADPVDPIANAETCKRDVAQFQKLGINTVRVYTVDNSANHDECMSALSDAGIYLALDVNSGLYSINDLDVQAAQISYNAVYLQNVFAVIDAFANYENTLLFFSGNEVVNKASNTAVAPYVKAVTRDMKQYIGERGYRAIPVGYSAADVSQNRYQMAAYMNCGTPEERSDFFAFNDYSWCDPSTFQQSGWSQEVQLYANYSIPLFLSETGCIAQPVGSAPRPFNEISALYTSEMTAVYSGALIYEYSEEADNPGFGLVQIESSTSVNELQDFQNLMNQYKKYPTPPGSTPFHSGLPPLACPSPSSQWQVTGDNLPVMPAGAQKYMQNGAGPGVGLKGPGSQNAGSPGLTIANPSAGAVTTTYGTASALPTGTDSDVAAASSSGAASSVRAPEFHSGPIYCAMVVVASAFLGAGLLL